MKLSTDFDSLSCRIIKMGCLAICLIFMLGCQEMYDQPRYEPLEESTFFEDGRSSRPLVPGTVGRGQRFADEHLYAGKSGGTVVDSFPFPITRAVLDRGRERYNIYCSPCHDRVGNGQGMVVRRGFRRAASFHTDRLREIPVGYFFEVITHGFGAAMPDYAMQISAKDRWAIVAYIRALQLSQQATLADVPAAERYHLQATEK